MEDACHAKPDLDFIFHLYQNRSFKLLSLVQSFGIIEQCMD